MSTLKANRYENTASSSGGIDIDSSGKLGFGTSAPKEVVDSRGAAVFSGDHATSQNAYGTAHGIMLSSTSNLASIKAVSNGSNDVAIRFIPLSSGSGSEAMRILAAGGLTFNGDTAAANALDDYEEGTWTPTYNLGTLTVESAHYIKIGNHVTYQAYITFPTLTNANEVILSSFPFNAAGNNDYHACAVNTNANLGYQLVGQYNRANSGQFQLAKPDNSKATGTNMSGKFIIFTLNVMLH